MSIESLSDAERHCLRHCQHVVVRGNSDSMTAQIIGGDASGMILRRGIASVEEAKLIFKGYDVRIEVPP